MDRVLYYVIQDAMEHGKTRWCETDDFDFLYATCQYMVDSMDEDKLGVFNVVWVNYSLGKHKQRRFIDFCNKLGIRKGSFEGKWNTDNAGLSHNLHP